MPCPKPAKKTPKTPKTPEARAREAELIRTQLADLGFAHDALRDVVADLDRFANEGLGCTATHRFPEYGVRVILLLSTQPQVTSYARVTRA